MFCKFWLGNALRAQQCAIFHCHLARWLRTGRFSEPTFRPPKATNHWEKHNESRLSYLFAHLRLLSALSLLCSSHFLASPLWLFPPLLFHLSILSEVWLLNFLRLTILKHEISKISHESPLFTILEHPLSRIYDSPPGPLAKNVVFFGQPVEDNPVTAILFYAPWCFYSQQAPLGYCWDTLGPCREMLGDLAWDQKLHQWWKVGLSTSCTPTTRVTTASGLLGSMIWFRWVLCREDFIDFQSFIYPAYHPLTDYLFGDHLPAWIPQIRQWTNIKWVLLTTG